MNNPILSKSRSIELRVTILTLVLILHDQTLTRLTLCGVVLHHIHFNRLGSVLVPFFLVRVILIKI